MGAPISASSAPSIPPVSAYCRPALRISSSRGPVTAAASGAGHGGQWQGPVDQIFQHGGHPIAIQGEAEQQQIAGQHLLQDLPHIVVDPAMPAIVFAGKAASAEGNAPVGHLHGLYLLGRKLVHARQKGPGDVHGVAFFLLGASVKHKNFHAAPSFLPRLLPGRPLPASPAGRGRARPGQRRRRQSRGSP